MENKALIRIIQFFVKIGYSFIKYPKQTIISHQDSTKEVGDIIKRNNLKKPLVVIDPKLYELGLAESLIMNLKENEICYAVFTDLVANPTVKNVNDGYSVYLENNCDCIIAFGGGSPIDTAKAIGAKVSKPKVDVKKFMGLLKIRKKIPTLIAIPTTAGTGSEATIAAVIVDEKTSHKVAIMDPCLMPKYAILDPVLTKSLSPSLSGTTGMDALCHALEAYTNYKYCTRKEKEAAKEASKLIYNNILKVYDDGQDLEARNNMQLAALYAGRAFTRGSVGYVHAIGHTLSGLYHLPHGYVMGVILPVVLENYGSSAHKRLSEIADYIGIKGNDEHEKANKLIEWIKTTNIKMSIPSKIKEIRKEDVPQIVDWAIKEANPLYPCPKVWNKKELKAIVELLME